MGHLVSLFSSYHNFHLKRQHPNLKIIGHRKEEHPLSSLLDATNDAKKISRSSGLRSWYLDISLHSGGSLAPTVWPGFHFMYFMYFHVFSFQVLSKIQTQSCRYIGRIQNVWSVILLSLGNYIVSPSYFSLSPNVFSFFMLKPRHCLYAVHLTTGHIFNVLSRDIRIMLRLTVSFNSCLFLHSQ